MLSPEGRLLCTVRARQSYHTHLGVIVMSCPGLVARATSAVASTVIASVGQIDTNYIHLHCEAEWSDHWPPPASPGYLIKGLCYSPQCSAKKSGTYFANVTQRKLAGFLCVNHA